MIWANMTARCGAESPRKQASKRAVIDNITVPSSPGCEISRW